MDRSVVIVATDGSGSLAGCARALSACSAAPTVTVRGFSGSFGRPLLGAYSARSFAADAQVIRRLRAVDAPLLHFTSHHLARYAPFVRRPYVVTVHDLIRHRDRIQRGAEPPLIQAPNLRDSLYLRLDALGLRRADALIAISEHTRRELVELLEVPPARVTVVPNGVDTQQFRPVQRRMLSDEYVLYVGSEQPRKNLATLFRAFMRARERRPDVKLVKVGAPGGPEALHRRATLDAARATGVLPHLLFADRVCHEELVAWYSGALCLVQPSRHEGFGLPPLEAMACGCPVVVSSGGALPEVVGDAGVVYGRPEDADALARELSRLLSSEGGRAALAHAGLERAAAMSWGRAAALTAAVWRHVLGASADGQVEPLRSVLPRPVGHGSVLVPERGTRNTSMPWSNVVRTISSRPSRSMSAIDGAAGTPTPFAFVPWRGKRLS
jgi:glycosyltransferase involved in cell wall biosynthesis